MSFSVGIVLNLVVPSVVRVPWTRSWFSCWNAADERTMNDTDAARAREQRACSRHADDEDEDEDGAKPCD
jgi:hypothetical protein